MSDSDTARLKSDVLDRLEKWALDGGEVHFDDLRRALPGLISAHRELVQALHLLRARVVETPERKDDPQWVALGVAEEIDLIIATAACAQCPIGCASCSGDDCKCRTHQNDLRRRVAVSTPEVTLRIEYALSRIGAAEIDPIVMVSPPESGDEAFRRCARHNSTHGGTHLEAEVVQRVVGDWRPASDVAAPCVPVTGRDGLDCVTHSEPWPCRSKSQPRLTASQVTNWGCGATTDWGSHRCAEPSGHDTHRCADGVMWNAAPKVAATYADGAGA